MSEITCKIAEDIVSIKEKDRPLIFISPKVINLKRDNDRLKEENERLNNIINELEKLLQQDLENEKDVYWTNITKEDYIQFMLKKIQELKGSDK